MRRRWRLHEYSGKQHCFALTASPIIYLGRHHAIRHRHMATHPRSQKLYIFRAIHTRKFTIFFRWPYISLGSRNNFVSFPHALIRHIRNHKQSDHAGSACCNGGEPTRYSHRNLIFKRNTQLHNPRTRLAIIAGITIAALSPRIATSHHH